LRNGDIYWVNLDPSIGDEIRKKLPVIVLNAGHVKHLRLAIVLPVTGWKAQWECHPFFVSLDPTPANGLAKKSSVDCFQLRAISHDRFLERIGSASEAQMDEMKRAIALILDIDPEHCQ
jgi:mRNA interferase MazF